jgi:hypothetical protein
VREAIEQKNWKEADEQIMLAVGYWRTEAAAIEEIATNWKSSHAGGAKNDTGSRESTFHFFLARTRWHFTLWTSSLERAVSPRVTDLEKPIELDVFLFVRAVLF